MGPPRIEIGLFITTAKFSQGAKSFADAQHIILVDGQKVTDLRLNTTWVYHLKKRIF